MILKILNTVIIPSSIRWNKMPNNYRDKSKKKIKWFNLIKSNMKGWKKRWGIDSRKEIPEYNIYRKGLKKLVKWTIIRWKIFINLLGKLNRKRNWWLLSIKLMLVFSISRCLKWQSKMKSSMLLSRIFINKLLRPNNNTPSWFKTSRPDGKKKEEKWKLKEKGKDKRSKKCLITKDKERDNIE